MQAELNSEKKGFKDQVYSGDYYNYETGHFVTGTYETKVEKLNSVTIPVIANYIYTEKSGKYKITGGFGIFYGFMKPKDSWVNKKNDLGYILNASFQYPWQKGFDFEGTLRYNHGLRKIDGFKTKSYLIGLGIIYHLSDNLSFMK